MKPVGAPRTLVGLACMLTALGLAGGTAGAQLPELTRAEPLRLPDEPVRQLVEPVVPRLAEPVGELVEPLQQIAQAPLPSPLEEVVENSPVAPLREEVREVVGTPGGGVPGGGLPDDRLPGDGPPGDGLPGGGSSSGGNPSASDAGASSPASPVSQASPGSEGGAGSGPSLRGGSGGGDAGGGSSSARAGGDGRANRTSRADDGRRDADRAGSASGDAPDSAPDAGRTAGTAGRGGASPPQDDDGPIARTVERIVEVVPGFVWVALGALSLLALALFARSHADRRRSRELRRERERLVRDMGLLERVLLPQVPERMGDLAVSVAYRPAAGPAAGGDFYDVFELPGGRVGLFLGDVSGHGREALESTSALRPALRGHLEAGLSPRGALEAAGRAAGIDPAGRFTTAVVAVHDPASGTLTYAQAGHPPPVVIGPGAHEPVMVGGSPPIGVGLHTGLRQTTVPLPRGSSACFVTDGLLEARSGNALLGREWLESLVATFGPLDTAEVLLDRVFEAADLASDDMTACLVRAVDGPSAAGPRVEELELARDDVGAPAPGRFLEACGVPAEAVEDVLADARRLAVQSGKALLTVTIDGGDASVRVTAPTREALATT